jgi:hypothetical protein
LVAVLCGGFYGLLSCFSPLQDIGLNMTGNYVTISHEMRKHLAGFGSALFGQILIRDNRPSCDGVPGPCETRINFILDLVQYELPCPDDLLRFTYSVHASVHWTAPVVHMLSGLSSTLSGSHAPGDSLPLGSTVVMYEIPAHTSQLPATRVTCSFTVSTSMSIRIPNPLMASFFL